MTQVRSIPAEITLVRTEKQPAFIEGNRLGTATITGQFANIVRFLSNRPLRYPARRPTRSDVDDDVSAAEKAMNEPGSSIPYEELRRELGLE